MNLGTANFGHNTAVGDAFDLTGTGGLTFTDNQASLISGAETGILAENTGSGTLSITTTGQITGRNARWIDAYNTGGAVIIRAVDVSGFQQGVQAVASRGIDIEVTGTVESSAPETPGPESTAGVGIDALTGSSSSYLTIKAVDVNAEGTAVSALNIGTGPMQIQTTGHLVGTTGDGITARNERNSKDLAIEINSVTGGAYGIYARNLGATGVATIIATGAVEGQGADGIYARNVGNVLGIQATSVKGAVNGINARHTGTGIVQIQTTGHVEAIGATAEDGIDVNARGDVAITTNTVSARGIGIDVDAGGSIEVSAGGLVQAANGTGLALETTGGNIVASSQAVSSRSAAVRATNRGTGYTKITASGPLVSDASDGVNVYPAPSATGGITISVAATEGGLNGIVTQDQATIGATSITASGLVEGKDGAGIYARNAGGGVTLVTSAVKGTTYGIDAQNQGSGILKIEAFGAVESTLGGSIGIRARNTEGDITIDATDVSADGTAIYANATGTGSTSISASGHISSTNGGGILVLDGSSRAGINIAVNSVSSGNGDAIRAGHYGVGAVEITATGQVLAQGGAGIYASNDTTGTDITVSTAGVDGTTDGIFALNRGTGVTSIKTTGPVIGRNGLGIDASTYGTDLIIDAGQVTGFSGGIRTINVGSGETRITTTGQVFTAFGTGIFVRNEDTTTNATVQTAGVEGGEGIFVRNEGSGALSITSTDKVTGTSGYGIYAGNDGTDLAIVATEVEATGKAITANNRGSGTLKIETTGAVKSTGLVSSGVFARQNGTSIDIDVASVEANGTALDIGHEGTGDTQITATGAISSTGGQGVRFFSERDTTGVRMDLQSVSGASDGVRANHNGTGALGIMVSGQVTGQRGDGINAYINARGSDILISTAGVDGSDDGIYAYNNGSGVSAITATGPVIGQAGNGINVVSYGTNVTINATQVTGRLNAINVDGEFSGETRVTATGQVLSTNATGIYIRHETSASGITVNTVGVEGTTGIDIENNGAGPLSVTSTGLVRGRTGTGVLAASDTEAVTLNLADVYGRLGGVVATDYAYGSSDVMTITTGSVTTGQFSGASGRCVYARSYGKGISITTGTVNAAGNTIDARNFGEGDLTIRANGAMGGGPGSRGVYAYNAGDNIDINVTGVFVGGRAIDARNNGSGTTQITATGTLFSGTEARVYARNASSATGLSVSVGNVTSGRIQSSVGGIGIDARSNGQGTLTITSTGLVNSRVRTGIYARNGASGSDLMISTAAVIGRSTGILAYNEGTGL